VKQRKSPRHSTRSNAKKKNVPQNIVASGSSAISPRYPLIDALRGVAIALMVIYHFCYDLVFLRVVYFDFPHDPFWLGFRYSIVTLFVGLVGFSLVLATRQRINHRRFFLRLGWLLVCAALVTVVSLYVFPQRFIFFGILHFIAFASVLGLFFVRFKYLNLVLGLAFIGVGTGFQYNFFDQQPWQFLGMMTHKPATEDYVPVLPWFGVVLLGMYAAHWMLAKQVLSTDNLPVWAEGLRWAGQHSLWIYMLHQPVLLGLLYIVILLF